MISQYTKRAFASGAALAVTLGLGASAPAPQLVPVGRECPRVVPGSQEPVGMGPEITPAELRFSSLGSMLVGYLAAKCERPDRDEFVTVSRIGNGAVTLTLRHTVPASPDGFSTYGNYLFSVTVAEGPRGVTGGGVTAMRVAETAGTSGKASPDGKMSPDEVTVFDMRATADTENGNWIVAMDNFEGYSMEGNTGASLAEPQAGDIVLSAIDVVSNEHSGEPVTYHP